MTNVTARPMFRGQVFSVLALLLAANLAIWGWAWWAFQASPIFMGTAVLAWVFGLRHAADADHIAAIDNAVRKLVQTGQRAWDGGLFFALGHSAIVTLMCLCGALFPSVAGIEHLRDAAGAWGTILSAAFLFLIALANLLTLKRLWLGWRRGGALLDAPLTGGMLIRALRPVQKLVSRSWHMLAVGFLFGLGFDTASEVALLALTGEQAATGVSLTTLLVLPALFTAGMVLVDFADSALMTGAYRWAARDPSYKLGYNIAVTSLSVFAALCVGGLELFSLLSGPDDRARGSLGATMLNVLPFGGFALAFVSLSLWGAAVLAWRTGRRSAD